jgi:hypothetical protein
LGIERRLRKYLQSPLGIERRLRLQLLIALKQLG